MKTTFFILFFIVSVSSFGQLPEKIKMGNRFYYCHQNFFDSTLQATDIAGLIPFENDTSYVFFYEKDSLHIGAFINRWKKEKSSTSVTVLWYNGNYKEQLSVGEGGLNGSYLSYHPNGYIKVYGQYRKGKKIGKWFIYDKEGYAIKLVKYNSKGEIKKEKTLEKKNRSYNNSIEPSNGRSYEIELR